ncbi:hypothetical protein DFQ28_008145 [Apophysomyces sp. BC1034]|nr:hypothetical protein DFQ30_007884 [Apophysomyces sp. BC1015]KAG0175870.1 hypothetical protein DFQ29_006843 [Apophysomyces sp. BC1021]KAG0186231.1 hypothetical protein DFQ28_008145 [Apophysomyces sp. BC1034]
MLSYRGFSKGEVPHLACNYVIDRTTDKVSFYFQNEPSFTYHQSLSQLKRYDFPFLMTKGRFCYHYRSSATINGSLAFTVIKAERLWNLPLCRDEEKWIIRADDGYLKVSSFKCKRNGDGTLRFLRTSTIAFIIQKHDWDTSLSYAIRLGLENLTREAVEVFLKSSDEKFTVQSTNMMSADQDCHEEFEAAITAIYIRAMYELIKSAITSEKTFNGKLYTKNRNDVFSRDFLQSANARDSYFLWSGFLRNIVDKPGDLVALYSKIKERVDQFFTTAEREIATIPDITVEVNVCVEKSPSDLYLHLDKPV